MIIDVHHHLNRTYFPDVAKYEEDLVRTAAEFGVARFCLSAVPWAGGWSNAEVQEVARRLPGLVVPLAYLNLDTEPAERVAEYAEGGFRGLKLIAPTRNYDDEAYFPVYAAAAERGWPLLFHTGLISNLPGPGGRPPSLARMRPAYLETIARAFPSLTVIGAHLGWPWCEEAAAVMDANPNVYFDLSGGRVGLQPPEFFRELRLQPFAWDQLVFGTDSLARDFGIPYQRQKTILEENGLPEETQRRIFYDNLARALGLAEERGG